MTPLIQLTGITKTLRGREQPRDILSGVDLTVHSGESVAILGRSGSGKSTLLSLIGLFDRPDAGEYLLHGNNITHPGAPRRPLRSAEFGFVFQRFFLPQAPHRGQNVSMALVNGQGWAGPQTAGEGAGRARPGRHRPPGQEQAEPALRRRTAAGRHRAGPGPGTEAAAGRRTDGVAGHRDRQPGHRRAARGHRPRLRPRPRHPRLGSRLADGARAAPRRRSPDPPDRTGGG